MRPRTRLPFSGQAGSVSVLTAGTLVLLMVLSMASVDLLRALQAVARAQVGADAAALAAAQEMAIPSGQIPGDVAAEYAERNGGVLMSCVCEPQSSEAVTEVEVVAGFLFLGPDRTVSARARAVIEPGGSPPPRSPPTPPGRDAGGSR
jgi:secretion/DNA translocation related TadE-like protein